MITAGSLFSGIGGLDLAASLAGFDIRWQCEIDPFCRAILRKHRESYWRNAIIFTDVRRLGRNRTIPKVDVIFGGFPCQDISLAGHGAGLEGARSGLWWEMWRIIRDVRPQTIVLENVSAIILEGRGGTDVVASLAKIGYDCRWGIISASDANAPHQRKRWFLVGTLDNTSRKRPRKTASANQYQVNKKRHSSPKARRQQRVANGVVATRKTVGKMGNAHRKRFSKRGVRRRDEATLAKTNNPSRPIAKRQAVYESRLGRESHGISARVDATRLMAHRFPNPPNMPRHDSEPPLLSEKGAHWKHRIKALGNAVVPQVVYPLFQHLHDYMEATQ